MSVKERLHRLVDELPDEMAAELEHYADYLRTRRGREDEAAERADWQSLALQGLSGAYAEDEPDYSDSVDLGETGP
jgi:hypothetical protein